MKLHLVTCIFLKIFSKVILLVITGESLENTYLLLKELQQFIYFSHSLPIMKHGFLSRAFSDNFAGDPCKKSSFVFIT